LDTTNDGGCGTGDCIGVIAKVVRVPSHKNNPMIEAKTETVSANERRILDG
jgi:hypothetical protein